MNELMNAIFICFMSFCPECEFQHHTMCHGCQHPHPAARLNTALALQIIQQWQNISKIKVIDCLHMTSEMTACTKPFTRQAFIQNS